MLLSGRVMRPPRTISLRLHLVGTVMVGLLTGLVLAAAVLVAAPVVSQRELVVAGLLALCATLVLVLALERRLVRFLRALVAGANAVGDGQAAAVPTSTVRELDD